MVLVVVVVTWETDVYKIDLDIEVESNLEVTKAWTETEEGSETRWQEC